MSLIDNVHANAQALLNRGPMAGRGPHNAGGPLHHHGGPHPGAGDRGFGPPKGGDMPGGVPRAIPGIPDLPAGPRGVERALPGHIPPGLDRPNPGNGPSAPPGQVIQGSLDVAQGLANALPPRGSPPGPPAHAAQGHGHAHGHGPHGAQAAAPMAMGAQPAMAGLPGSGTGLAAQLPGVATTGVAVAQAAGAMPAAQARGDLAQQAALPLRADAGQLHAATPPRGEGLPVQPLARGDALPAGLARADAAGPLQATLPGNASASTLAAAAAATAAVGATLATAATAPALPAAQGADARNVAGLAIADRGQAVRAESMSGTYTGEGPQRRRLRRGGRALPGSLSALLVAMGAQGRTSGAGRDAREVERELQAAAMQWLFWLLAIIAYGCVAFAIVGLLPSGSGSAASAVSGRGWSGGFAIAGLVAAGGAWWFARHLARGGRARASRVDSVD
ncbi:MULTISPECIES: hypothetical protein [unclassified Luteimonas]|uniref:hypothetical protein n=1 Tax=unclassified Luteimonas TaxID=2629088 RepID=UPI001603901C|nr:MULTISPECIES: hypothetical protein [unclassified Luteimonas]MBB1473378.1 hypothetical protein [Luteimonas sp. MC1782]MBB6600447.1 hypothetical protein [Luteimonas sp. MC1825]QOC88112.1 hypothetical protein IDM46_13025 [Luteimonas sp. MC1825]